MKNFLRVGNTRFELSWEGDFAGVALVFLCPQGTEMERVDGAHLGAWWKRLWRAQSAVERACVQCRIKKKATITRHRRLFRVYRIWGIET